MKQRYIGLISGTSVDAFDVALVAVDDEGVRVEHALNYDLHDDLRAAILDLTQPGDNEIDRLGELDNVLGEHFASAALTLLQQFGLERDAIRAIGSHGQTLRHRPEVRWPFTLQAGNPAWIAARTGITTVADFRRADMAVGGQGAPLVPAFHEAVFRTEGATRAVVNIGGMANITILPASPEAPVTGFDTGPGNVLLDAWSQHCLGQPVDRNGGFAASGKGLPELLETLLQAPYFAAPPPKSTGREAFHLQWLEEVLRAFDGPAPAPADVQATLAELTARSISDAVKAYAPDTGELFVCGGGVHNRDLLARLDADLPGVEVASTARLGLDPDFVEAACFGWLAHQALEGRPGNVPSVTGARQAVVLGAIYPASGP